MKKICALLYVGIGLSLLVSVGQSLYTHSQYVAYTSQAEVLRSAQSVLRAQQESLELQLAALQALEAEESSKFTTVANVIHLSENATIANSW
jgi:hypothetical protein